MRETKSKHHPVNASCLNFEGIANVGEAEKETITQTVQRLLLVRHSVISIISYLSHGKSVSHIT